MKKDAGLQALPGHRPQGADGGRARPPVYRMGCRPSEGWRDPFWYYMHQYRKMKKTTGEVLMSMKFARRTIEWSRRTT